jgi:outer membrane protein assembly factor BamB
VLAPTEAVAALRTRDCRLTFTTPDAEGDAPLVARAAADGTSQWRYGPRGFVPVGVTDASELFAPVDRPPAVVVTGADGTVAALRADGTVDWTFAVDTPPAGVPVAGRLVYVPDGAGTVYALTAGGTERWRVSLPDRPRLSPLADGVLARSHRDGRHTLVSLRRDGTERWRHRTTAAITPPAVAGTRVFLGRADDTVLALSGE